MERTQLLDGVRVVDLTKATSGPFATQILGDLGADVIKVEEPPGTPLERSILDPTRHVEGLDAYFMSVNRNKRSVVLPLADEEGLEAFHALVREADVVVDNFRPGVSAKLRVDHEHLVAVNPSVVTCSLTGYGREGPLSGRAAYDVTVLAETGMLDFMSRAGGADRVGYPGAPVADLAAGMYCAIAIPAALHRRAVTGEGCHLEVSMYDAVLSLYVNYAVQLLNFGSASHYHDRAVWGAFDTASRPLVISADREQQWRRFCVAIERDDLVVDARFDSAANRTEHFEELSEIVTAALLERTADEWIDRFDAVGLAYAEVRSVEEVLDHEQTKTNRMAVDVAHPSGHSVRLVGSPIGVDGLEAPFLAPPIYGEHTDEVLCDVGGYRPADIARLRARRAWGGDGDDGDDGPDGGER